MSKQLYLFLILFSILSFQAQTSENLTIEHSQTATNLQKTLYIYRPLINGDDLYHWAQEQGIKIFSEHILHVTLAYSSGGLESEALNPYTNVYCNSDLNQLRKLDLFGKESSTLVLKFDAPELVERWIELREAGANWDWPDYQPHITLTYEAHGIDLSQITPYSGDLIFGPEVFVEF